MSLSKHDRLVDIVADEMRSRGYTKIYKNIEYNLKRAGEIDLYVVKNRYVFLFEMKSGDSIRGYNKAIDQLDRAKKYYFGNKYKKVFKFYVCDYDNPTVRRVL